VAFEKLQAKVSWIFSTSGVWLMFVEGISKTDTVFGMLKHPNEFAQEKRGLTECLLQRSCFFLGVLTGFLFVETIHCRVVN